MKTKRFIGLLSFIAVLAISLVIVTSCNDEHDHDHDGHDHEHVNIDDKEITENFSSIEINVEGMTCTGCENTVTNAIMELSGINHAKLSHVEGNAVVEFDNTKTSEDEIKKAIVSAGYKVIE